MTEGSDGKGPTFGSVVSNNQSGGITAGVVNIHSPAARTLTDELKRELLSNIGGKSVRVIAGNDPEAWKFAEQIQQFLAASGANVYESVHWRVRMGRPSQPLELAQSSPPQDGFDLDLSVGPRS